MHAKLEYPGLYLQDEFRLPTRPVFSSGVPVFLGVVESAAPNIRAETRPIPHMLNLWPQFRQGIGDLTPDCYLAYAVRGFFENGGCRCFVIVLKDITAPNLDAGLQAVEALNTVDLVCAPNLVNNRGLAFEHQQMLVDHCERLGNRFAILDSRRGDDSYAVWNQWSEIDGNNGAVYYPWLQVQGFGGEAVLVPPCGHVAGIYARSDESRGTHKAPANEVVEGAIGLERQLTNAEQAFLNPKRINCIRSFSGRGIRVWGAHTLSGQREWTFVNVRRLFLTVVRWIQWNMQDVAFEPNDAKLWARIERELNSYFRELFHAGALKGSTPEQAFYVKCNGELNRTAGTERNEVVTEIGLAPANPYEFVVVRLIHGASGVSISGPVRPEKIN
jgi:phage tail sheath protein FI